MNDKNKKNILYFMKGKLTPIDNILPFLVESFRLKLIDSVCIIVFDKRFKKLLDSSPFYFQILKKYNIKIITRETVSSKANIIILKLIFIIKVSLFSIYYVLKKNTIIIGLSDIIPKHSLFPYLTTIILRFFKFKNLKFVVSPQYGNLVKIMSKNNNIVEDEIFIKHETGLITSYEDPKLIFDKVQPKEFDIRYTGKIRCYDSWKKEVYNYSKKLNISTYNNENIVFWPLSILVRYNDGLKIDIAATIFEVLNYLSKKKKFPKIIFKYHPTTDVDHFKEILDRSNFKNYEISFDHSAVLISKSNILFSTIGTSLFNESWIYSVPNVLYISKKLTRGKTNGYFMDDHYAGVSQFVIKNDLSKLTRTLISKKLKYKCPKLRPDKLKKNIFLF